MNETSFIPLHMSATAADLEGNDGVGRYLILPGSDGRARSIAAKLEGVVERPHPRAHNMFLGKLMGDSGHSQSAGIDVAVVSTGMGPPSIDIIMNELIGLGGKTFIRIGTAGSLQPEFLRAGQLVIPTGCVRDESTSGRYLPVEVPAVPSLEFLIAAGQALEKGRTKAKVHFGVVHSKDSLYAREFGSGPMAQENHRYMELLKAGNVLASEMECSQLFILSMLAEQQRVMRGDTQPILAGAILGILGDDTPFSDKANQAETVDQAIICLFDIIRVLHDRRSDK